MNIKLSKEQMHALHDALVEAISDCYDTADKLEEQYLDDHMDYTNRLVEIRNMIEIQMFR